MSGTAPPLDVASLRFGVNIGWMTRGGDAPVAAARAAEDAGFDIVTVADHVGSASPFVALAAAAAVTERVRLRTYVLDAGFWNAGLLARDVATLDVVSGGRVDLGIGAGHMPHEHAAVGLPFPPYAERVSALAGFVAELRRLLADPEFAPRPVQTPLPILIGAMSERGLDVAARVADVVSLTGAMQAAGERPGTLRLCSRAETDARVARVRVERDRLGLPARPLDALLQQVTLDREPGEAAAEVASALRGRVTIEELLDSPFMLFARSAEHAAEELVRRSARWGIESWCVHAPSGPALARAVEVLRS